MCMVGLHSTEELSTIVCSQGSKSHRPSQLLPLALGRRRTCRTLSEITISRAHRRSLSFPSLSKPVTHKLGMPSRLQERPKIVSGVIWMARCIGCRHVQFHAVAIGKCCDVEMLHMEGCLWHCRSIRSLTSISEANSAIAVLCYRENI